MPENRSNWPLSSVFSVRNMGFLHDIAGVKVSLDTFWPKFSPVLSPVNRIRSLASIILTQEGTEHLFGSHRVFPLCYNTVFYSKTSTALCDVVFNCNVKTKKGFWLRIPQRIPYLLPKKYIEKVCILTYSSDR